MPSSSFSPFPSYSSFSSFPPISYFSSSCSSLSFYFFHSNIHCSSSLPSLPPPVHQYSINVKRVLCIVNFIRCTTTFFFAPATQPFPFLMVFEGLIFNATQSQFFHFFFVSPFFFFMYGGEWNRYSGHEPVRGTVITI